MLTYEDFDKIELCVGTITKAEEFPEARKPMYKLWIDFGELGMKTSAWCWRSQIVRRRTVYGSTSLRTTSLRNAEASA